MYFQSRTFGRVAGNRSVVMTSAQVKALPC